MNISQGKTAEKPAGFPIRLIIVSIILISLLLLFTLITNKIVIHKNTAFDISVYHFFASVTSPAATRVMIFFTFFGSSNFLLPFYLTLVAYYLFYKKDSKNSSVIALVSATSTGALFLLKDIFKRERPTDPLIHKATGFSYPSGHSFSAFAFSSILIYLIWISHISKSLKWICTVLLIFLAVIIASSRIYLHMHYASDVIAGFCLSLLWLSLCYFVLYKLKIINRKK